MSSLSICNNRKRHYFPEFRDDSDSEELPRKKLKNEVPIFIKTKLDRMTEWFRELRHLNSFARMSLIYGARGRTLSNFECKDDSEDDDDVVEDVLDVVDDDDDDDIQEIKENVNQESLSPLAKQFRKTCLSSPGDSGRSMHQAATNGKYYIGSYSVPRKLNGPRELSTRLHGTSDCNIRIEKTNKLKRRPLISNPPTELEIYLGSEPEVVTIESDGVQIVSESPSPKQKQDASQKSYGSPAKLSSKSSASAENNKRSCSSSSKFYTANEVVRLQEKAQYQLLLDKYVNGGYPYRIKKPQSVEEIQDAPGIFSTSHFKREVLYQPVDSFLEKYYKPCRLVSSKESSEKTKEPPPEIVIDDDNNDDDDDVKIVEMKLPEYKTVFKSKPFSVNWVTELRRHVHSQTEERNKIVEDYERKLAKLKKERLLRRLRNDLPASKAEVEPEYPELTPEMEDTIDRVLTGPPEEVIVVTKAKGDKLCRKDFDTLVGLKWLNDAIINCFFDMIVERSKKIEGYPSVYAFNTFFYGNLKAKGYSSIRRWTRKTDIFSYDINFVPIHLHYHWCLGVIDHRSKKICYYDSMGNGEEDCLRVLLDYLCQEYKDKKGGILDPTTYITETMKDIPQQMNGSDCGMFTLRYAEYLSRDAKITFAQSQMPYFRRRAIYELYTDQLL